MSSSASALVIAQAQCVRCGYQSAVLPGIVQRPFALLQAFRALFGFVRHRAQKFFAEIEPIPLPPLAMRQHLDERQSSAPRRLEIRSRLEARKCRHITTFASCRMSSASWGCGTMVIT